MSYLRVTSLSNIRVKELLDIKNKRGKYRNRAFIIEGPHLIEMALTSGENLKTVLFTNEFSSTKKGRTLLKLLSAKTGEAIEVKGHILAKLSDTETPQGILAVTSCTLKNLSDISFRAVPLIVVIDGVQEPGNLGAIIRTSDAAGADAVIILKGSCDVFMQKTIRATAGSIFNMQIAYSGHETFLEWLHRRGIKSVVTSASAPKSVFDADLNQPAAITFGNEAHGISQYLKESADLTLKIPLYGKAESLNVGASAAICLYEAVRQRCLQASC